MTSSNRPTTRKTLVVIRISAATEEMIHQDAKDFEPERRKRWANRVGHLMGRILVALDH